MAIAPGIAPVLLDVGPIGLDRVRVAGLEILAKEVRQARMVTRRRRFRLDVVDSAFGKISYPVACLLGFKDPAKPEGTMSDQGWQEVERQWLEVRKTVEAVIANLGPLAERASPPQPTASRTARTAVELAMKVADILLQALKERQPCARVP